MSNFEIVTPDDNLLEVAEALRPAAYRAGDAGDIKTLRDWAQLNADAQRGCGGNCSKSPCERCQPVGALHIGKVLKITQQCSAHENPYVAQPPAWILALNKGEK
jgi:hypothetical protein